MFKQAAFLSLWALLLSVVVADESPVAFSMDPAAQYHVYQQNDGGYQEIYVNTAVQSTQSDINSLDVCSRLDTLGDTERNCYAVCCNARSSVDANAGCFTQCDGLFAKKRSFLQSDIPTSAQQTDKCKELDQMEDTTRNCYAICCAYTDQAKKSSCFDTCAKLKSSDTLRQESNPSLQAQVVPIENQLSNAAESVKNITSNLPLQSGIKNLTPTSIIAAVIFILIGLVLVFAGHLLFKPVLFIAGFNFFALFAYIILVSVESSSNALLFGNSRSIVFLVICIVAGLIGGLLFMLLWRLGLSAVGGLFGFFLALFIIGLFREQNVITNGTGRIVFIVVLSLLFAILVQFIERPILILGTAFPGAYSVFFGVDVFANTGLNTATIVVLSGGEFFAPSTAVYGMLGGVLILGIVGCLVQWRHGKRHAYRDSKDYRNLETGEAKPKTTA